MNRLFIYLCLGILVQYLLAMVLIQIFPLDTAKEKAIRLALRNKYRDAISAYTTAIEEDKNDAESFYLRGKCYSLLNLNDQALADFNQAIELDSKNPLAYLELAEHYYRRKMITEAEKVLQNVFELAPDMAEAYFLRGRMNNERVGLFYFRRMKFEGNEKLKYIEQSVNDFDQVISLQPKHLLAHKFRADMYFSKGDFQQAIDSYTTILEQFKPNELKYMSIYMYRGWVYKEMGDCENAVINFDQEMELKFNELSAKFLIECYEKLGRSDKVKEIHSIIENQNNH